jgi:hypothetical protein
MVSESLRLVAHMHLKVNGSKEKWDLFYRALHALDLDFPMDPDLKCTKCNRRIYKDPVLTENDIRDLARQINDYKGLSGNLKIKLKNFNFDCPGSVPDLIGDVLQLAEGGKG